jgi:predicted ArsR family transcriptional regulator
MLRLCLERARTNQELAQELALAPASALRHVRQLVRAGFLVAGEVRGGKRGALERPYSATGASWELVTRDIGLPDLSRQVELATVAAHHAELAAAQAGAVRSQIRGTMRLKLETLGELIERVEAVLHEYDERDEDGGEAVSFLWSLHGPAVLG